LLDEIMPPRPRIQITLVLVLVIALCVFVPGFLYFTELALRELRLMWGVILVLALVLWVLTRLRPRK
jgi:hypothetical protein